MIENPKTLADVQANFAEAEKIKQHMDHGLSAGEAEYAANLAVPGIAPRKDDGAVAQGLAKFKAIGLSDGEADFAANMVLPK